MKIAPYNMNMTFIQYTSAAHTAEVTKAQSANSLLSLVFMTS